MTEKIAAIVVTYNRKELLLRNILACLSQKHSIDKIFVVDNHGTDNTKEYLKNNLDNSQLSKISYHYLEENIGGSGGFNYGTKLAYDMGYDLFWLMDDDGYPYDNDTLDKLLESRKKIDIIDKPFLINSIVLCDDNGKLSFGLIYNDKICFDLEEIKEEFVQNSINPFNGTLFNKELINLIGVPRGDYFIKGDEVEFFLRAKKHHCPIYTIVESKYRHPSPFLHTNYKIILGKKVIDNTEAPWKEYYTMRNTVLNFKMYEKSWYIKSLLFYIKRRIKLHMFSKSKKLAKKLSKYGFKDGKKGKTGIVYLPGNVRK